MNAHELGKKLLAGPDLPVVISTGSVEDEDQEVCGDLIQSDLDYHRVDPYLPDSKDQHIKLS